jgi:hypothetical protein
MLHSNVKRLGEKIASDFRVGCQWIREDFKTIRNLTPFAIAKNARHRLLLAAAAFDPLTVSESNRRDKSK